MHLLFTEVPTGRGRLSKVADKLKSSKSTKTDTESGYETSVESQTKSELGILTPQTRPGSPVAEFGTGLLIPSVRHRASLAAPMHQHLEAATQLITRHERHIGVLQQQLEAAQKEAKREKRRADKLEVDLQASNKRARVSLCFQTRL